MENGPFQNAFPIENGGSSIIHCYYIPSPRLANPLKSQFWVDDFPNLPFGGICCCRFPAWYLFVAAKVAVRPAPPANQLTSQNEWTSGPPGWWVSDAAHPRVEIRCQIYIWYTFYIMAGWFRRTYNNKFTTQTNVCGLEELHVLFKFLFFLYSV